jgi:deazaflavin-dependent oxidoreductase (nitroreductase family)
LRVASWRGRAPLVGHGRTLSTRRFRALDSQAMAESDDDQLFGAEHVRVYRETGGERGYHWRGTTILLLSTRGRKSGEQRTTPLIHRTDGDRWVIVASKGGAPEHPGWYENLLADPDASIEVKDETIPVRASTAEGEERSRLWALMAEVWPAYDDYQTKTDREIPVVLLTRRSA